MISPFFSYSSSGQFDCEEVSARSIIDAVGTPVYVYSANGIRAQADSFLEGLPSRCYPKYAVKANTNPAIIQLLHGKGFGLEVVSRGELCVCLSAHVDPASILLGGIGKSATDIARALDAGVGCISLDSEEEIALVIRLSQERLISTRFIIRCNPNIDGATHPYLTTGKEDNKFGIDLSRATTQYGQWQRESSGAICGLHIHIGSQIIDMEIFTEVCRVIALTVQELRSSGSLVQVVDLGGGLGVSYEDNTAIDLSGYKKEITRLVAELSVDVIVEPGRYLVAESGVAIGSVLGYKTGRSKDFVITDLALNDFIRPSLYGAYHEIVAIHSGDRESADKPVDIVGPVCESGDFLGRDRSLARLKTGDAAAVLTAGAYGFSMSSNYNSRPKPAEVLIDGSRIVVIRERQLISGLL